MSKIISQRDLEEDSDENKNDADKLKIYDTS